MFMVPFDCPRSNSLIIDSLFRYTALRILAALNFSYQWQVMKNYILRLV